MHTACGLYGYTRLVYICTCKACFPSIHAVSRVLAIIRVSSLWNWRVCWAALPEPADLHKITPSRNLNILSMTIYMVSPCHFGVSDYFMTFFYLIGRSLLAINHYWAFIVWQVLLCGRTISMAYFHEGHGVITYLSLLGFSLSVDGAFVMNV